MLNTRPDHTHPPTWVRGGRDRGSRDRCSR